MKDFISVAAGILAVLAITPYIRDIIKGKTKPNVVSWFTWTLLLVIATSAAFAAHQPRSAFLTLGDLIGTGTTLLLGLKYGIAKFSWFDGACQVAAIVGLILWLAFNSPAIAIIASIVVDLIAAMPTLRHSWLHSEEETWETFAVLVVASALTIISLSTFSVISLSFALYLLTINFAIASTVIYRRRVAKIVSR